jgi:hypothetical protein
MRLSLNDLTGGLELGQRLRRVRNVRRFRSRKRTPATYPHDSISARAAVTFRSWADRGHPLWSVPSVTFRSWASSFGGLCDAENGLKRVARGCALHSQPDTRSYWDYRRIGHCPACPVVRVSVCRSRVRYQNDSIFGRASMIAARWLGGLRKLPPTQ